jgi:hypothetical protein
MSEFQVHVALEPFEFPVEGVEYVHTYRVDALTARDAVAFIERNWPRVSLTKITRIWAEPIPLRNGSSSV